MKASYSKPLLAIETFMLTQTVARDCSDSIPKEQVTSNDIANCVWDLGGGMTVFVGGKTCDLDGDQMGIVCYNNPSEGNFIFKS